MDTGVSFVSWKCLLLEKSFLETALWEIRKDTALGKSAMSVTYDKFTCNKIDGFVKVTLSVFTLWFGAFLPYNQNHICIS